MMLSRLSYPTTEDAHIVTLGIETVCIQMLALTCEGPRRPSHGFPQVLCFEIFIGASTFKISNTIIYPLIQS